MPNRSTDSYSFAVLLEEILSHANPFDHFRSHYPNATALACAIFCGDIKLGQAPNIKPELLEIVATIADNRFVDAVRKQPCCFLYFFQNQTDQTSTPFTK